MRFRSLDTNWDWNFGTGSNAYVSGSFATAYNLKTKILSWFGDCFFNAEAGIDWKNLLGTKVQKKEIDDKILNVFMEDEDVTDIVFFESAIERRKYNCTARVKTIYGDTIEVKI